VERGHGRLLIGFSPAFGYALAMFRKLFRWLFPPHLWEPHDDSEEWHWRIR
jgi:hypothetical protein